MQMSPHFDSSEFDQHDGTPYPPALYGTLQQLVAQLEVIRAAAGNRPMTIISGYRSPEYNRQLYESRGQEPTDSQHSYGTAADISVEGMSNEQLQSLIADLISQGKVRLGGLGTYANPSSGVHVDIRKTDTTGRVAQWGPNIVAGLKNVIEVASRPSVAIPLLLALGVIAYVLFAEPSGRRSRA